MATDDTKREIRLKGIPISDGLILGNVRVLPPARDFVPHYEISAGDVASEQARMGAGLAEARHRLQALIEEVTERIGEAQGRIFVAQKMMVEDPLLQQEIAVLIAERHINAEAAIASVLDRYEEQLREVDDEYITERASDIGEVRRRLVDILRDAHRGTAALATAETPDRAPILVAEDLSPSDTVGINATHVAGIITERGGRGAHAAILARSFGIPAVSAVEDVLRYLHPGERVLVNGSTGEVIIRPSEDTVRLYPAAQRSARTSVPAVAPVPGLQVHANISIASDVDTAVAMQAEGIGLYRTEFEFLAAGRLLDEQEQFERYQYIVRAMRGRPVTMRLLDFGADKPAPFLKLPQEENPCLGYRGARLLQGRTDLLITQARAMARASREGPIGILYPMIIDVVQFLRIREIITQHTADISGAQLSHGIMFEVPSACFEADALFATCDFGSVGTNDLIQYLFAVDRNNTFVAHDYDPDRPVFWRLLGDMAAAARRHGKKLSLCGEIGGQPQYLPLLLDHGYECVSVSARLIGVARRAMLSQHPQAG